MEATSNEPRRHPLNRTFAWAPRRGPYRRVTSEQAAAYDRDGFFVLEDAVSPLERERLLAEIDPVEAKVERFLQGAEGGRVFIARAGEITFSTFVLGLASAVLIHLGVQPNPETGTVTKDLVLARQSLDLLAMLREKTRGNLTAEEERFFESLLSDLRLQFVEATRK